jgi:hypothetical protein
LINTLYCFFRRSRSHLADQVKQHTDPCKNKKDVVYIAEVVLTTAQGQYKVTRPGTTPGFRAICRQRNLWGYYHLEKPGFQYITVNQLLPQC